MNGRTLSAAAVIALGVVLVATMVFSQAQAGEPQSPGWFLQASAPDPGGRLAVGPGGRVIQTAGSGRGGLLASCAEDTAKFCTGQTADGGRACLAKNTDKLSARCRTAVAALPAAA